MNVQAQSETLDFQTEVTQLLNLVVNSLYSNKEIFLRELISNASDALDKLRFEALSDSALFENDSELKIEVDFDPKKRTITVRDNGIGMSREEIIENLGTIAKSGTRDFLKSLSEEQAKDRSLIGQFGVGFYASFVVSDKVTVKSRRAGMKPDQGVWWESEGKGIYTLANIEKLQRGTEVILHLKKDEDEFLNDWRLRNIITKYSDHILFPILMPISSKGEKEKEKKEEKEFEEPQKEQVNRATALWTLPKKDIKEEEYNELYKHISHDFENPLLYSHNRVEGKFEYISLLYVPSHVPFDLWQRDHRHGLKLYVDRVFIMDNAEQLLPNYLRFIRGIIDSKDLPLNISREILQHNKIIDGIRLGVIKRVLDMLESLANGDKEKYGKFWQMFGQVLKEGIVEDFANKNRIAKLLRFSSTYNDSDIQDNSLDDYLSRMQEGQEKIYYIIADTFSNAKNSPHLELLRKKGVEVLLLSDRIDEWITTGLGAYKEKEFKSIAKGDLDLGKLEDEKKKKEGEEKPPKEKEVEETDKKNLSEKMTKILANKVKEVRFSSRLVDSPACLIVDEKDMSTHFQKLMRAYGQDIPESKPILEINPKHPLIERLYQENDEALKSWAEFLFAESLLAEGGQLENPAAFVKKINEMLIDR